MKASTEALKNQKQFYDGRFAAGYMEGFEYDVYERCRLYTVRKILSTIETPRRILDYGCGQGRYIAELHHIFPDAKLCGCDISDTGLKLAKSANPNASFIGMNDETIDDRGQSFDLVISIEVLEHVGNVREAVREIVRVMDPGGMVLITTPCANKFSLEWFLNWASSGLQLSHDGYARFATDEPGHLRRLTSNELNGLFMEYGADPVAVYYRSHLFTTLLDLRAARRFLKMQTRAKLALLDWHLFKHFSNGATMLALYQKRRI